MRFKLCIKNYKFFNSLKLKHVRMNKKLETIQNLKIKYFKNRSHLKNEAFLQKFQLQNSLSFRQS